MTTETTAGKQRRWMLLELLIGLGVVAGSGLACCVLSIYLPRIFDSGITQFFLVLSFVAGSILVIVALHKAGRISRETLDRTTLTLAVSAIIFAVWQFRDSRLQESRMKTLANEMSTRFVGTFPKNIIDINEVVALSYRRLDIMADFAGYGHYSAPDEFDKYLRSLETLSSVKQLPIRLLVYSRSKGERIHNTQFTEANFATALRGPDPRLVAFSKRFNMGKTPQSKKEFDSLLFRKQRDYLADLKEHGVEIRVTTADLPFFLWNEDDQEAVVSFLNEDLPEAREVSFRTRDTSLVVDTFKVRFCKLWNDADEVDPADPDWRARASDHNARSKCVAR